MWTLKFFTLALSATTHSAAESIASETTTGSGYTFGWQFFKMVLTLAAFVALLLAIGWTYRKFGLRRALFGNTHAIIQILERRALSQKTCLYLIEIEGRRLLIGDSPAGISYLTSLSNQEPVEDSNVSFAKIMERKLNP